MFHLAYIARELRRRLSRTILTALGLAMGVGLVIGIIGVSQGLDDAQAHALAPLHSVGTDILVTRVDGGTAAGSTATTTTTQPNRGGGFGGFGGGPPGDGGGGGFFAGGGRFNQLNQQDELDAVNENSNVVTDLSKLGKPGTKFTHDFFLSATLLSYPQDAVAQVAKIPGVTSAVPGLLQKVQRVSGTVPEIVAQVKTGGQTLTQTSTPAPMTDAERQAFFDCLAKKGLTIRRADGGGGFGGPPGGGGTGGSTPTTTAGGGGGQRRGGFIFGGNPAIEDCQPARFRQFRAQIVVPRQIINQVVNTPQTDINSQAYIAAGVDPSNQHSGLITVDQLRKGKWFTPGATDEVLLSVSYADKLKVDVGASVALNGHNYKVVGLVVPTLSGSTADIYFPLPTLQNLATKKDRVTQIFVKASSSDQVDKVAASIKALLPGATVLTSKDLANQASGSLSDAQDLAHKFSGVVAMIVLAAAFVIAALLTLSSVSKRVREIGTLRAIGWSKGRVVRQLVGETIAIAIVGGAVGLLIGVGLSALVHPTLTAKSAGVTGLGSGSTASLFNLPQTAAQTVSKITIHAPLHASTFILGVAFAIVGGLLAGLVGSWRAARLAPATALRDIG
ncbi:MAG TPA: FtsX-like permease family protein [Acidimicrobiia bacterium]|nr:FtsX-like permease family protein [Acidimicrobiia bacterium]